MTDSVGEILISADRIRERVSELASAVRETFAGQELVLVSVLKGSVVFLVDLMKQLDLDVEIGFLYLSSYRGETSPQSAVQEFLLPFPDIEGRNVLIVEDILDTGSSLVYAWDRCMKKKPATLKTCVLLVKEGSDRDDLPPVDFHGFRIPREFVVGYGLDYREKYRQFPYIAILPRKE